MDFPYYFYFFPCRFTTDGKLVTIIRRNQVTLITKAKLDDAEEKRKCACPSPVISLTHYRQPVRVSTASNVPSRLLVSPKECVTITIFST